MWIDWLDLPKLTSLRGGSSTFWYPHHITLESDSHPLWVMTRHAQSHRCASSKSIRLQGWRHNHRKYSLHPFLTNRHWSSSTLLQLITERHVTPLFVPHTHNTPFPSTSELIQRHSRERYRCVNTEIMTIRIWNDGNPIRIVETGSNDHSLHIACNPHRFAFQITCIAFPFKWEPKLNNWKWQQKHQSSCRSSLSHHSQPNNHIQMPIPPKYTHQRDSSIPVTIASYSHQIAQSNNAYPHSQPHFQITLPHP